MWKQLPSFHFTAQLCDVCLCKLHFLSELFLLPYYLLPLHNPRDTLSVFLLLKFQKIYVCCVIQNLVMCRSIFFKTVNYNLMQHVAVSLIGRSGCFQALRLLEIHCCQWDAFPEFVIWDLLSLCWRQGEDICRGYRAIDSLRAERAGESTKVKQSWVSLGIIYGPVLNVCLLLVCR